ncbi:MAG: GNAT family N-acetyltransferase [Thermoplasmata archaeon]|nr:GNAT family N-acetyltransferase [Thermoplasmata archaeon]
MTQKFRRFNGDEDMDAMYEISTASALADGMEMVEDFETFCESFSPFLESLPSANVMIVEMGNKIIGHARVWWADISDRSRLYSHMNFIHPDFANSDIRREMMDWAESRLMEIASKHPLAMEKKFEIVCVRDTDMEALVNSMGYAPSRYFFEMLRPLKNLPDIRMPESITISTVKEDEFFEAWRVTRDAFKDHWSYVEKNWSDQCLEEKLSLEIFTPSMWFVAKSGKKIVGSIQNYIEPEENKQLDRKRGYISNISTSKEWRGRGIASALISRSMGEHSSRGIEEVRLTVDSDNSSGALALYKKLGFEISNTYVNYRKPIDI